MKTIASYLNIATMILIMFVYTGCTDLTESPYTFIDPNSYYKTEAEINTALNATYRAFRNMAGNIDYVMKLEVLTDQGQPSYRKGNVEQDNRWENCNSSSNSFSSLWKNCYQTINRANIVLGRGEKVELNEVAKKRFFAQARFLRAYSLFHLVRIYGGCPVPLTYTEGVEGLEMPRKSVDEVYNQIIDDLEFGIQNLPLRGEDSNYDVWRATSGACHALLGEVYLYRATLAAPENDNMAADKELLKKSLIHSKEVIQSGKYQLVPEYTDLWYWFNTDCKNNQESIFELQYAPVEGNGSTMHKMFGMGTISWKDCGGAMYNRFGPSTTLYASYAEEDTRKKAFLTNITSTGGVTYVYNEVEGHWNPALINEKEILHPGNCKYYDRWTDPSFDYSAANFPMLRYAEVLLNYAEAANLLNAGDGLEQLNLVRQRAGLNPLSGMSQKEFDEAVFQERCWEFVGEAKIYYDELRKGKLGELVEEYVYNGYISKWVWFNTKLTFKPRKSFLWMIPKADFDSNPMLEQNPVNESLPFKY